MVVNWLRNDLLVIGFKLLWNNLVIENIASPTLELEISEKKVRKMRLFYECSTKLVMKGAVCRLKEWRHAISCNKQLHKLWWRSTVATKLACIRAVYCVIQGSAACSYSLIWFWWAACRFNSVSSRVWSPHVFSLYTVIKISSISYPYQCLFAPSAQKGKEGGNRQILGVWARHLSGESENSGAF